MPPENVVGLAIVFLLAIGIAIVFESVKADEANRVPVSLTDLNGLMAIAHTQKWTITVLRRSSYVHGAWSLDGSRSDALNLAVGKLRQARIVTVEIIENNQHIFKVCAYYESTGSRRTGKYVGGFEIRPS